MMTYMSVEDVQDASIVEANMDDSSDDNALINLVAEPRPAPARGHMHVVVGDVAGA